MFTDILHNMAIETRNMELGTWNLELLTPPYST